MTDPKDAPKNGWNEWANFVLKTLEKLEQQHDDTERKINQLILDLKILQFKTSMRAGFIGALAGFLPAAAVAIYFVIKITKIADAIPPPP